MKLFFRGSTQDEVHDAQLFPGQVTAFMTLVRDERKNRVGPGVEHQKTGSERSLSDGAGRALLLKTPLDSKVPIALLSTTTQRAGYGLIAKSSFISEGISELMTRLADERLYEVVMPVLGAGHGGMDSTVAFVTLVLALAEAVRYFPGGGRPLRKATIIVFRKDSASSPEIDPIVIRRTLAITGASSLRREVAGPR